MTTETADTADTALTRVELTERVLELIENNPHWTDHQVTSALLLELSAAELRDAFTVALPQFIYHTRLRGHRFTSTSIHGASEDPTRTDVDDAAARANGAPTKATPTSGPSSASRHERLFPQLSRSISLGDGRRKPLRECTLDEVTVVAERRFGLARANDAAGKRWLALAELMQERGATVVGDLPEAEVEEVLGG